VIEVKYDDYPSETGWSLRDSTGALIASRSTGSFSTVGGTVVKTANVGDGAYTFEMTDTFGDGICCLEGNGEFKITVNGELAASNNGDFEDVVRETFDVVGRATTTDVDYHLDVKYDNYPLETSWSLKSLTTGEVVVASEFNEVSELGFFLSRAVDLIAGDEYELEIIDSVGDGMCCLYGEGSINLYATVDRVDALLTSSNGSFGSSQTNVFTVPDFTSR
jgi:hypothetical protein